MLGLMRKKAQSWMIKVLFGVIIIVFVFFYGYGRRMGRKRVIAEINGTEVTDTQFRTKYQKAYQNLVRLYQSMYGDQFDEGMIDRLGLRERVLKDIIDETLLVQEAGRLGLRVTPEEIRAAIRSNPAFQVNGKFNEGKFMAVLQMNGMGEDEFEKREERNRLIRKVADLIGVGGVEVSDQEAFDAYALANEKINLRFVRFNAASFEKSVSTEESEVEAYYSKNASLFEVPPKVEVEYLVFSPDDYLESVSVGAEEIREEYEYNLDRYRVPRRVKVSHIFIKAKGEKSVEEARKKAERILEEARKGGDFAALARKYSEDKDSAGKGGSIGWVTEGGSLPDFAEAALSLNKGEVAPLFEGKDGFHIVKVEDVQEEGVKSLKQVEEKIRAEIARTKSEKLAGEEAQEAFFSVYDTKDLEGYAAQRDKTLMKTGLFSRRERLKEMGGNLEFNDQAFSLQEGEVSSPLEIGGKIYLIKVVKREDARIPAFEEVKEKVREELVRDKAVKKAEAEAQALLEEAKKSGSLAKAAASRGLKVDETGLFERGSGFIPKVGPAQALGDGVFSMSPERRLLDRVVAYGQAFFVVELKEEQTVDMKRFQTDKERYRKRLYAEKRGYLLQQWLEDLRKKSEIKVLEENIHI